MKDHRFRRIFTHILQFVAGLMILAGILSATQTFATHNKLFLDRQDQQLERMANAADENIAQQLDNVRESLRYIQSRRGFVQAERSWVETGDAADLIIRMQDNLVTQNPVIHSVLAVKDNQVILNPIENTDYTFPSGMEGELQPCYGQDGKMYLALFEDTSHGRYAALMDVSLWYADEARLNSSDSMRLLLLDSKEKILLHQWQGDTHITAVADLNETNCDLQAVRSMMEATPQGDQILLSYQLTYPGDNFVHGMRMNIIPLEECVNDYFIVGLTSDYDEIITPMHTALINVGISGAMIMAGVLTLTVLLISLAQQNRHRDQELQRLIQRNEETQKLLEKTRDLAHHQRLETIGTLTASIAHEFNNLLTPIMGYSILTLEGLPEDCSDLADNVAEIYEASRKAKDIIARLNTLSRRNAEESFQPLSLSSLVSKALSVAKPALPPNVTTRVQHEADDLYVSGSETQLSQLLLNLILNAYQAMEVKGGTLTLTLRAQDGQALVLVQDTGVGIPADAISRIFEPFYTSKESGRGTGLGLAIVRQVAESHHGDITVDSMPGQGSVFTLRLPGVNPPPADIS